MPLFHPGARHLSERHERLYSNAEIARTICDFLAAFCFVAGSIMFFYAELVRPGTWMFLIGSLLFAMKPTIRLWRELRYLALSRQAPDRPGDA